jgi:hypothetical protein
VPTIQGMVEEGGTYKLENVMVGFNEGPYKPLPYKHKLNMSANARFTKVNAGNLPRNMFEFMSFKYILISPAKNGSYTRGFRVSYAINNIEITLFQLMTLFS